MLWLKMSFEEGGIITLLPHLVDLLCCSRLKLVFGLRISKRFPEMFMSLCVNVINSRTPTDVAADVWGKMTVLYVGKVVLALRWTGNLSLPSRYSS